MGAYKTWAPVPKGVPTSADVRAGRFDPDKDVPPCPQCGGMLGGAVGSLKCTGKWEEPEDAPERQLTEGCGWDQQEAEKSTTVQVALTLRATLKAANPGMVERDCESLKARLLRGIITSSIDGESCSVEYSVAEVEKV